MESVKPRSRDSALGVLRGRVFNYVLLFKNLTHLRSGRTITHIRGTIQKILFPPSW
jgi:hypothetical protein